MTIVLTGYLVDCFSFLSFVNYSLYFYNDQSNVDLKQVDRLSDISLTEYLGSAENCNLGLQSQVSYVQVQTQQGKVNMFVIERKRKLGRL